MRMQVHFPQHIRSIKTVLALGLAMSFVFFAYGQPDSLLPGFGKKDFRIAKIPPKFEGGNDALFRWIHEHVDPKALETAMMEEGMKPKRFMTRFWVQSDGTTMGHEVISLPTDGSSPVANVLLKALKSIPKFKSPALDAYDNPSAFNFVVPVWPYGSKILVGKEEYLMEDVVRKEDKWYYGSFPFFGVATGFHPNGKKEKEISFQKGMLGGKSRYWDEEEKLLYTEEYQKGELVACYDHQEGACRARCEGGTPRFLPGIDSLERLRKNQLKYPLMMCGLGAEVTLSIQIDRDSTLFSARIINAQPGYGREAMSFVHALPDAWAPCKIDGKPVNTRILFPLRFEPHVNTLDSLRFYNGLAFFRNQLFTGWVFSKGPQLQMLQKGWMEEGKKEGVWRTWDKENRPINLRTYRGNLLQGEEIIWDTLQRKVMDSWWEKGNRESQTFYEWWGTGDRPRAERQIDPKGNESEIGWYDLDAGAQWYAGERKLGKRTGTWNWWHPNGAPQIQGEFENDAATGTWIYWDKNGKELETLEYQAGTPLQGIRYEWWENGQLKSAEKWKKGKQHGTTYHWDRDGQLLKKAKWKKGTQKS